MIAHVAWLSPAVAAAYGVAELDVLAQRLALAAGDVLAALLAAAGYWFLLAVLAEPWLAVAAFAGGDAVGG